MLKSKSLTAILCVMPLSLSIIAYSGCSSNKPEKKESAKQESKQKTETDKSEDQNKKYGMTEMERKDIYFDLNVEKRKIPSDEQYGEKFEETYSTVAERYNITEHIVEEIEAEGREKYWSQPGLP